MKVEIKETHLSLIALLMAFVLVPSCGYDSLSFEPDCENAVVLETVAVTASACDQEAGSIEVQVVDQTLIDVEYSIDGVNFQTEGKFENLSAGTYTITAKNTDCEGTLDVQVENAEGLNASAISNPAGCSTNDGSIEVTTENASGNLTYSLDGGDAQSDATFSGLAAGTYSLSVRDEIGCEVSLSVEVAVDIEFEEVQTIVNSSCALSSCHGGNVSPDFRVRSNILNNATRIRNFTSSRAMPPSSSSIRLTDEQIATIQCWVDAGAEG